MLYRSTYQSFRTSIGSGSGGVDKGGGNVPKRIDKCQSTFIRVDPRYHPKDTTGQDVQ